MSRSEIQHLVTKLVVSNEKYLRQKGVTEGVVAVSLELPDGDILYETFSIHGLTKQDTVV